MCYVCMCIHAERARGRGPLVHMWNSGSGVNVATSPRPLHISRIDHRCSDAQGLRNPESRQPRGAAAGRRRSGPTHLTPELQNGRDPARMSSQRLTRGVAPHAQTPKSRRSDSQDCEENPSLFGFLLGTRDAGVDLPRTNFGGPCPEPQRPGGSLDPESRGPLGCREGHFRYRHVPHSPRGEALGEAKLYMLL